MCLLFDFRHLVSSASEMVVFDCLVQKEHFPFIYCVETLVYEHQYTEWTQCFDKLGVDPKPIMDCYNNGRGTEVKS